MQMHTYLLPTLVSVLLLLSSCKKDKDGTLDTLPTIEIAPGPNAHSELQQAIDQLCSQGGGLITLQQTVEGSSTSYQFEAPLEITNCKNVSIRGVRFNTSVHFDSSRVDTCIQIRNSEGIRIEDLNVYASDVVGAYVSNSSSIAIRFVGFYHEEENDRNLNLPASQYSNLIVNNVQDMLLFKSGFTSAHDYGVALSNCQNVKIDDCQIWGFQTALSIRNSQNIDCHDSQVLSLGGLGCLVYTDPGSGGTQTRRVRFTNTEFEAIHYVFDLQHNHPFEGIHFTPNTGLALLGAQQVDISNCYFEEHCWHAIVLASLNTVRDFQQQNGVQQLVDLSGLANPHTEAVRIADNCARRLSVVRSADDSDLFMIPLITHEPVANVFWDGQHSYGTAQPLCMAHNFEEIVLSIVDQPQVNASNHACDAPVLPAVEPVLEIQ